MKALTLWQPWAAFVAAGIKVYETRSWYTKHRGRIAIHAAVQTGYEGGLERYMDCLVKNGLKHLLAAEGAIICVGHLLSCDPTTTDRWTKPIGDLVSCQERDLGNFSPGRYAWRIEPVTPLRRPVFCRGAQGLWSMPHDVEALVLAEIT
jgi:hypothetical protein